MVEYLDIKIIIPITTQISNDNTLETILWVILFYFLNTIIIDGFFSCEPNPSGNMFSR